MYFPEGAEALVTPWIGGPARQEIPVVFGVLSVFRLKLECAQPFAGFFELGILFGEAEAEQVFAATGPEEG